MQSNEKDTREIGKRKAIRSEEGQVLIRKEEDAKNRWESFEEFFNDRALERGCRRCNAIMRTEKDNYRRCQENHSKNGKWQSDSTIIRDK